MSSRFIKNGLRAVCALSLLALIFAKVKLPTVRMYGNPLFISAFAICVCLNLFQSALCTFRWRYIQHGIGLIPPFITSFWAYLECCFCNQALPSFIGGDAVRVLRWRDCGVDTGQATASVLFDRVFGAIGASVLALIACGLMWRTPVEIYKTLSALALAFSVLAACIVLLLILRMRFVHQWFSRFHRIYSFLCSLDGWAPPFSSLLFLAFLGLCGQLSAGLAVFILARAFSIPLPFFTLVSITGIILLISMIPASLAGWGVREAGFIALLTPFGVSDTDALALSVFFGLSMLVGALPGGLSILFDFASRQVPAGEGLQRGNDSIPAP